MTSESSTGFKEWLNNHIARHAYDKNLTKVCKLCFGQGDPVAKFKLLTENKNLVLLTKVAFENKCQTTYFHSVVGVPINLEEEHHVALLGMESGDGVEVESNMILATATKRYVLSLLQLMKIESHEDLQNISGTKK